MNSLRKIYCSSGSVSLQTLKFCRCIEETTLTRMSYNFTHNTKACQWSFEEHAARDKNSRVYKHTTEENHLYDSLDSLEILPKMTKRNDFSMKVVESIRIKHWAIIEFTAKPVPLKLIICSFSWLFIIVLFYLKVLFPF